MEYKDADKHTDLFIISNVRKLPRTMPARSLLQRYRQLSVWNKLGLWGSLASIVSFAIYFLHSTPPEARESIHNEQRNEGSSGINVIGPVTFQALPTGEISTKRARIAVADMITDPPIPEAGKPFAVKIVLKNFGETPAKSCKVSAVVDPVPKDARPDFDYKPGEIIEVGFITPDVPYQPTLHPVHSKSAGGPGPINEELIASLSRGDFTLFTHGRIDYKDVAGNAHWTTWCASLILPFNGRFGVSSFHNDSDD